MPNRYFVLTKICLNFFCLGKLDVQQGLIDFSTSKGRSLQLMHAEKIIGDCNQPFGFLPNGDLIIVSIDNELKDYKIYLYPFKNKPTAKSTTWKYSQINDIEIPESLKNEDINCSVYQTKLFLYGCQSITQFDLSTMAFDMQYFFDYDPTDNLLDSFKFVKIVINKNETLLALSMNEIMYVFSMETGTLISRCEVDDGWYYFCDTII